MSDEREKKSWREIDRMKDHGGSGGRSSTKRSQRNDRSSERYKAMLDRAFERGEMGKVMDHLSGSVPGAPEAGKPAPSRKHPSRQKLLYEITSASTPSKALDAFEKYHKTFGLPDDTDALIAGLDHEDHALVLDVIDKLDEVIEKQGPPRRSKALLARLQIIADDFTADEDLQQAAARLAERL